MATRVGEQVRNLPWLVWNLVVEVLAFPVGLVVAPFFALGRGVQQARSRDRVSAHSRVVAVVGQELRIEGRRANDFLRENLNALARLQREYLRSTPRTAADAHRAFELYQLAVQLQMQRARAVLHGDAGAKDAYGAERVNGNVVALEEGDVHPNEAKTC